MKHAGSAAQERPAALRFKCACWTGRRSAGVDLCPPPDGLSKREVAVDHQRRVVAEALVEVDRLAPRRCSHAWRGQVVVEATKNLRISRLPQHHFTAPERPRSIHDRRQNRVKRSPAFTVRSGARGHQRPIDLAARATGQPPDPDIHQCTCNRRARSAKRGLSWHLGINDPVSIWEPAVYLAV